MSISGISSTSGSSLDPASVQNINSRVQQDFARIAQSLQSNNLSGAQQAYSDLVQLTPGGQSVSQTQPGSTSNPIQSDLASLGSALQSGNVDSAQTAFSKLETDLSTAAQGTQGTGHHHHRHHGSSAPSASTTTAPADATSTSASTSPITAGSVLGTLVKTGLSLLG